MSSSPKFENNNLGQVDDFTGVDRSAKRLEIYSQWREDLDDVTEVVLVFPSVMRLSK